MDTAKQIYFDTIDTEAKAYWLGFIHADAHIGRKQITLNLSNKDCQHLTKLAAIFDRPVSYYEHQDKRTGKFYGWARCALHSVHMSKHLLEIGTKDNSGHIFTAVPASLLNHCVRGFFDGDGSVGHYGQGNRAGWRFTLVGEYEFLVFVREIMVKLLGLRRNALYQNGNIWGLAWGGVWALNRIREWMYYDATIFLERKQEIFVRIPSKRGISRFVGVYRNERGAWIARLYYHGKTRHIGSFQNESKAALAYDKVALGQYGDSAALNFPEGSLGFDTATPNVISDFMRN